MKPFRWQRVRGPVWSIFGAALDFYQSHGYLLVPVGSTDKPIRKIEPKAWSLWVPSSVVEGEIRFDGTHDTLEQAKRAARDHRRKHAASS